MVGCYTLYIWRYDFDPSYTSVKYERKKEIDIYRITFENAIKYLYYSIDEEVLKIIYINKIVDRRRDETIWEKTLKHRFENRMTEYGIDTRRDEELDYWL